MLRTRLAKLEQVHATPVVTGGKGSLDAEPCEHNGGKGAEEVLTQAHKHGRVGIQQVANRLECPVEIVRGIENAAWDTQPPRDAVQIYGSRKFCKEVPSPVVI